MTTDRLDALNKLRAKLREVDEMQKSFLDYFKDGPSPQSDRNASVFLIGGGNYNPSEETWKKIRELLAEDLSKRHAEAKVEFEFAS